MVTYKANGYKGNKIRIQSNFNIGDFVTISDTGKQYSSYTDAFLYFWGNEKSYYLTIEDKEKYWKIINAVVHSNQVALLFHIRDQYGHNVVISSSGLRKSNFHKRNRDCFYNIEIGILPSIFDGNQEVESHTWKDKLWKPTV